jgi:Family of unknown function (DUF5677)
MPAVTHDEVIGLVGRMHGVLISLQKFDELEIRAVVKGLISPTPRDVCFAGVYYRTAANASTLRLLNNAQHFQSISMAARAMFELSVDIRLLDVVSDGVEKMLAFSDVERLRAARNIVKFKNAHPSVEIDDAQVYEDYVHANGVAIDGRRQAVWPNLKKIDHWSGMNLRERVEKLKAPFDETYEVEYPRLSWQTHAGLAGVTNLDTDVFIAMSGNALGIAANAYEEVLHAVINEYEMDKIEEKIHDKLRLAKMLPFTKNPQQARQLQYELLGY